MTDSTTTQTGGREAQALVRPISHKYSLVLYVTLAQIGWRNLWRNRRRTWLTVGGIAFAVWFLVFARSMQTGSFDIMIDNTARMFTGHVQVQHPRYEEEPRVDITLDTAPVLAYFADSGSGEYVSARTQGYALVSVGERSFGAQIVGVQPAVEGQWSSIAALYDQGRYLQSPGEAYMGATLAQNLGLSVGDEFVVLGTAKAGGIAAMAAELTGTFSSSNPAFDRAVVNVHIDDFRVAWDLAPTEAHGVVVASTNLASSDRDALLAKSYFSDEPDLRVLNWRELMPETEQMSTMKGVSTELLFYVIAMIVGFSIVNTFMMMIFERTPELGVLMAMGMRRRFLQAQLQMEAMVLAVMGVLLGLGISALIIMLVGKTGIPLPIPADAMEFYARFNMGTRIYPAFDWSAFWTAAVVMALGTQVAAFIPGLRLRRLNPVEAIRQEA